MNTFGSFSGGAAVLLEATPLVVGTQKYQSGQSVPGVLGEQIGWNPGVMSRRWGACANWLVSGVKLVFYSQGHLDQTPT